MAKQKSLQYGLAKRETTTKVERQLKIVERYFKSFRREGHFAGRSALLEYAEMMLLNTWIFAKNSKHVPTNTFRKRMSCANEAPVHCLQRGLDCHIVMTCTQVNMRLDQMSVQCPCLLSLSALPVPSSALSMQMYSMICVYACRFSVEICSNLCDNSHKCQSACLACSSCAPLLAKKLVGSYSGVFACKRKAKLTSIAVFHVHSLLRLGLPASELEGGSQERLKVPAS